MMDGDPRLSCMDGMYWIAIRVRDDVGGYGGVHGGLEGKVHMVPQTPHGLLRESVKHRGAPRCTVHLTRHCISS